MEGRPGPSLHQILTQCSLEILFARALHLSAQGFSGIACDSRLIQPGFLFVGVAGNEAHGENFLDEAVAQGAVGFLSDYDACARAHTQYPHLTYLTPIEKGAVRQALASLAALFFPMRPPFIAAVTGTNGKSTVVDFARQLWTLTGVCAASLGTLGLILGHDPQQATTVSASLPSLTTPDPISLCATLQRLREDEGCQAVAMEVGSHGLDQYRCDGLRFQAGVFTNFSQDHLDYHGTMEAYWATKCRLFHERMDVDGQVLIHDSLKDKLKDIHSGAHCILYGQDPSSDLAILRERPQPWGQEVLLRIWGHEFQASLPFWGRFQVSNLLAAIGIVLASGMGIEPIVATLPQLKGVPGRMEYVGRSPRGGFVLVDYAHTPEALQAVLIDLRVHTTGKLKVVFGCGGGRDQQKRPLMGQIARTCADSVIITDDNPRYESPLDIRQEIRVGCPDATEVADRAEAIEYGIQGLDKGDILVIAGKGHETVQIVGNEAIPFSDREVAQHFLSSESI